jgi:hypothetical protein
MSSFLDAFTGRGPAVQGRSLFATLMCTIGPNARASGTAGADDGESDGGAAAGLMPDPVSTWVLVSPDVTVTVNEMGGRQFEVRLPDSSDISEVKVRLERAGAAPVGRQVLFVGGEEDECRDGAVVSQLFPDGGVVPRVLFLLVRTPSPRGQRTGPGESQPDDIEISPSPDVLPDHALAFPAEYDALIKLVFVGDCSVGKTDLIGRVANSYRRGADVTSGFRTPIDLKIVTTFWHEQRLKLKIWDTAGQDRFNNLHMPYIAAANVSIGQ